MFTTFADMGIDAVQTAKKQFVSTFVKHDQLAKEMTKFIDAQAEYTKQAIQTSVSAVAGMGEVLSSKKFSEELAKSFSICDITPKKAK